MKPEAVIIGGGLWFLRDNLRDFEGYRTALQELLNRSMEIFIKVTPDRVDSNPVSEQTDLRYPLMILRNANNCWKLELWHPGFIIITLGKNISSVKSIP